MSQTDGGEGSLRGFRPEFALSIGLDDFKSVIVPLTPTFSGALATSSSVPQLLKFFNLTSGLLNHIADSRQIIRHQRFQKCMCLFVCIPTSVYGGLNSRVKVFLFAVGPQLFSDSDSKQLVTLTTLPNCTRPGLSGLNYSRLCLAPRATIILRVHPQHSVHDGRKHFVDLVDYMVLGHLAIHVVI